MSKELKKRIITSVLLFLFAIFCIFINYAIFFIAIIVVSYFAFDEISFIIYRTIRSISNWKHLVFNSVSIFYAFGIFSATAIGIYRLSGPVFFLYILSICICSDLGGYIIGKTNFNGRDSLLIDLKINKIAVSYNTLNNEILN